MNFENLFGKKENNQEVDDKKRISEMISQKIHELELSLNNERVKLKANQELTDVQLKRGNKFDVKRNIFKYILIEDYSKAIDETIMKLEDIKFKLDRIEINTKEELNSINNKFNSIIKNFEEETKKEKPMEEYNIQIEAKLNQFEKNLNPNQMADTYKENEMQNKIIELEKRIMILENKMKQLEENKNQNPKETQKEKENENFKVSNEEENNLKDFLAE